MSRCSHWTAVLAFIIASVPSAALSHPLGSFSIDHYSRLWVTEHALEVLYVVDFAEIPTVQELTRLDANGDGRLSPAEVNTFLQARGRELTGGLTVALNGVVLPWRIESTELGGPIQTMTQRAVRSASGVAPSPAAGLPTMRIRMRLVARFPDEVCRSCTLLYDDSNFRDRTGWKEIVGDTAERVRLISTSVSPEDISRQLTRYPPDAIPPQDLGARLVFDRGAARREAYAWVAVATTLLIALFGWRRHTAIATSLTSGPSRAAR